MGNIMAHLQFAIQIYLLNNAKILVSLVYEIQKTN